MSKGQLQEWLDNEWVRIGADGSILGSCGGRKEAEGKPKCLPKKKAQSLSKEEKEKILTQTEKVNLLWFQIN